MAFENSIKKIELKEETKVNISSKRFSTIVTLYKRPSPYIVEIVNKIVATKPVSVKHWEYPRLDLYSIPEVMKELEDGIEKAKVELDNTMKGWKPEDGVAFSPEHNGVLGIWESFQYWYQRRYSK